MTDGGNAAAQPPEEVREHLEPLVPVSRLEASELPVVTVPQSKVEALSIVGAKRAKSGRGTIRNHELGILGEYAVAKHLGVPDRVNTEILDGGDPGYDLMYRGRRVDVKTAGPKENNPSLRVGAHRELRADFFVLAHQLNRTNYRIIGYAPRLLVKRSPIFTFSRSRRHWPDRYGDQVYMVEQDSLRQIGRLDG